jgi:hypothetical protein
MSITARIRPVVVVAFVLVLLLHAGATFAAWSLHPGNMARVPSSPSWFQENGLRVLAAPCSWLLPASVQDEQFWLVLLFNSALWALAAAGLVSWVAPARQPRIGAV